MLEEIRFTREEAEYLLKLVHDDIDRKTDEGDETDLEERCHMILQSVM